VRIRPKSRFTVGLLSLIPAVCGGHIPDVYPMAGLRHRSTRPWPRDPRF